MISSNFFLNNDKIDINSLNSEEYSFKCRKTALCYAKEEGDIEIVKPLLEHKNIDVNAISEKKSKTDVKA